MFHNHMSSDSIVVVHRRGISQPKHVFDTFIALLFLHVVTKHILKGNSEVIVD